MQIKKQLGEINENLTSLYLAEKSRVLTNMVLRRYYLEGESASNKTSGI
jgi:hypothetical protein